jgi:beta-ribofuranosylaminobenzene 5'-phosphate synthase
MIAIEAPARIHCGLLNEAGLFGRIDGGIGFALENPKWRVELKLSSNATTVTGIPEELSGSLHNLVGRFHADYSIAGVTVTVTESVPLHAGLGAKTSFLMAIGAGIAELLGLNWDVHQIASYVGRGGTSGIGVNAFARGGLVWDVGRTYPSGKSEFVPSSSAKFAPPRAALHWPVPDLKVVHFRFSEQGLHGLAEQELFRRTCPVDMAGTTELLAYVSGLLLPSIVDGDEIGVGKSINAIQGLGLKASEWEVQSRITKEFRHYFGLICPHIGLGLSSMGPTMYCICTDPAEIIDAIDRFKFIPLHLTVSDIYRNRRAKGG